MKNKLIFKVLITSTLIKTGIANAEVDLSQGSFIFRDKTTSLGHIYNSRSLHQGLLGAGWCTPYEDALDVSNRIEIKLRNCTEGSVVLYRLPDPRVTETANSYTLKVADSVKTFDKNGKLLQVKDERGKLATIIYDKNGFIKEIISERKDSLKLTVDPRTGRVVEEIDPRGARTRLTFLNGNLVSIAGPKQTKYFEYDAVGNVTQVIDGKKITTVTYDNSDQVTRVKVSDECFETYSYQTAALTRKAEVTTNCRGINNKRLVDFFYSKLSNGEIALSKVLTQVRPQRLPATQNTESH